jgi:hypothetical protein
MIGGIAKERSGLAAQVRIICPEINVASYNETNLSFCWINEYGGCGWCAREVIATLYTKT